MTTERKLETVVQLTAAESTEWASGEYGSDLRSRVRRQAMCRPVGTMTVVYSHTGDLLAAFES